MNRSAQRLLSENRGGFGSRVWAIQRCLKSGKPELTELAERSYALLLSELPDAFGLEHTYRNQQPLVIFWSAGTRAEVTRYSLGELGQAV